MAAMITRAQLPTREVRYLTGGTGERTMVLLHAFPLNADQWLPQLARVPPGWRYVAPDFRGFGDNEWLPGSVSLAQHGDDVLELMNHLNVRTAVVCGLSMGGYVAFAMLRKAAERIAGLVLCDTRASADTPEAKAGRERLLALVDREGPAGVAREMVPKLLGETTRHTQPDLTEVLSALIASRSRAGVRAAVEALRDRPDATDLLPLVRCPALVLCGAEDTLTPPAECAGMASRIPGSELVVLEGAGHLSNLEAPVAFNEALARDELWGGP
jgi:pimeloyl-ACP methyl ester carboxylesterase